MSALRASTVMIGAADAAAVAAAVGLAGAGCGTLPPHRPDVCGAMATARTLPRSQCGASADFTPINQYRGAFATIQDREDAVALIGGDCTGTLIAAAAGPVVLTAGHCVGLGDQVLVAFNVEAEPDGDPLATSGSAFERSDAPDYALIRLDQLPAAAPVALTRLTSDRLAVIQHPRGGLKVIAEGDLLDECSGQVFYTDLDTLVGSSGAGVLNLGGYLLGVHTDGDCAPDGSGANRGWTAAAIVEASAYLVDADIAER